MSFTAGVPIYYGYDGSPFVAKLETILLLKNIPARRVDVALVPPRPELVTLLGLPYRRVPVLALGRDIYADTSLIATILERRFPASHGHPTLFPSRKESNSTDSGLQKILTQYYADKQLFSVGFGLLPWTKFSSEIQADRKQFVGRDDVDFAAMGKERTIAKSTLASHLMFFEEQLDDGREWIFDTENPGLFDASVYPMLSWCRSFRDARTVFDPARFPKTVAWLNRMDALIKQKRQASSPPLSKISGLDAANEIFSSPFLDISSTGFDEIEANLLGLRLGDRVSIGPDDTGKDVVTVGKLVALSREETVIETEAKECGPGTVRVHFPRLGYVIKDASAIPPKL